MSDELRYIKKGQGQPRNGMIEQGNVTVQLATQHQEALTECGFEPDKTAKMAQEVKNLQGTLEDQQASQSATRSATADEVTARAETKAFTLKLRKIAPIVLREHPEARITLDKFLPGETLGDSTSSITAYLIRIRPFVVALDEAFRKYFKRVSPVETLDRLQETLSSVDSVQETSLLDLPASTRAIYACKGRLLELIEDCNRVAWVAFENEPELRAKFNKDLLLRARKSRKGGGEPQPK